MDNITSQRTALNNTQIDQKPLLQLLNNYESLFCFFIYCGKIENFEILAIELLVTAYKYAIKELSIKCEQYLQSTLNSDNVLNILCLADKYNSLNLKKSAIDFFI